jgi:Ca-activated chloride channel family protein
MFNSKISVLFLLLFFGFVCVQAQEDDVIKVDSSIVRLNVGVADQKGRPITNLQKQNFTVYENGIKQNVSRFEPTATPFSVVMILDMSGSTLGFRETIRQSAFRFVDALAPEDRVAVIEFYDKVNLRNDFTTNRKEIFNSISVANGRGKTQLYKALDFALEKLSKEGNRRKAVIVLTDGVDSALREKDHDVLNKIDDAQMPNSIRAENNETLNRILSRSDALGATIYPLVLPTGNPAKLADPNPLQTELYSAAQKRLQVLAARTGGTLNAINRLEDMGRLYAEVAADLRTLYTIEYQPTDTKRDGKFRTIRIEVDNPTLLARTRQGYVAK